jgi:hypothetical protein
MQGDKLLGKIGQVNHCNSTADAGIFTKKKEKRNIRYGEEEEEREEM